MRRAILNTLYDNSTDIAELELTLSFDSIRSQHTNMQFRLPLHPQGTYNFDVYVNNVFYKNIQTYTDSVIVDANVLPPTVDRLYNVRCTGTIIGLGAEAEASPHGPWGPGLQSIDYASPNVSWGMPWNKSFRGLFRNAYELKTINISDYNSTNIIDFSYMFSGCSALEDIDISGLDTSNVTNMKEMFRFATNFNSDISNWDVSKVTNMYAMFQHATNFNQDLGSWDVSKVTNMYAMFNGATKFNSDISNWDVSKVTNMNVMFHGATNFNSDISNWDVSRVTNMNAMFQGAINFDQDLGGWDVSNVTDMRYMFILKAMSTENYSNTLIGWANNPNGLKTGVSFHGGNSKYNAAGAVARQHIIDTYGWTIVDGGAF